jgi:hypothetical protein
MSIYRTAWERLPGQMGTAILARGLAYPYFCYIVFYLTSTEGLCRVAMFLRCYFVLPSKLRPVRARNFL